MKEEIILATENGLELIKSAIDENNASFGMDIDNIVTDALNWAEESGETGPEELKCHVINYLDEMIRNLKKVRSIVENV